jgi:hypothetical protein
MNTFRVPNQPTEEVTPQVVVETPATPASPETPARKSGKVAKSVRTVLSGEFLTRESLINHLPFIGFVAILFIINIALMYYFENTHREIVRQQNRMKEIRSEYNTTLSTLETRKQQSSVARDIEALGLKELRTPPQFIEVEPEFFEEEGE